MGERRTIPGTLGFSALVRTVPNKVFSRPERKCRQIGQRTWEDDNKVESSGDSYQR